MNDPLADRSFGVQVKVGGRHDWRLPPRTPETDCCTILLRKDCPWCWREALAATQRHPSNARRLRWLKWVATPVMRENQLALNRVGVSQVGALLSTPTHGAGHTGEPS